jgi:hypothetical protein
VSPLEKSAIGIEQTKGIDFVPAKVSVTAEAVEKANLPDHFFTDVCLHQSTQNHV